MVPCLIDFVYIYILLYLFFIKYDKVWDIGKN